MSSIKPTIIASDQSWIEGEAVRQLEQTASLEGIVQAVGMPDLHPGRGIPIGAAFLTEGIIYPHLVGNDIGCGMAVWQTDMLVSKFKIDKCVKKLKGFEEPWDGDAAECLKEANLPVDLWPSALGTIGGGNHFAEFLRVETVHDEELIQQVGLNKKQIVLLVHSGSRGLGQSILEAHTRDHGAAGLRANSDAFSHYLKRHDEAVRWSVFNRNVIADRFLRALGMEGHQCLDIGHNAVTPHEGRWLHRKGAAPSDKGFVVIPGSRGTWSYIVKPIEEQAAKSLWSLAHGAGRKWKRSDAKGRLSKRYSVSDLTRTSLGGRVICEDKALIYEEAPEAYKDVEVVIQDLQREGLIDVVATLRPQITYKTRQR